LQTVACYFLPGAATVDLAGFAYCRNNGYPGFTDDINTIKNAEGITIGVKVGCY
jgi:hypothetical protein